jgi:hypothetical protein
MEKEILGLFEYENLSTGQFVDIAIQKGYIKEEKKLDYGNLIYTSLLYCATSPLYVDLFADFMKKPFNIRNDEEFDRIINSFLAAFDNMSEQLIDKFLELYTIFFYTSVKNKNKIHYKFAQDFRHTFESIAPNDYTKERILNILFDNYNTLARYFIIKKALIEKENQIILFNRIFKGMSKATSKDDIITIIKKNLYDMRIQGDMKYKYVLDSKNVILTILGLPIFKDLLDYDIIIAFNRYINRKEDYYKSHNNIIYFGFNSEIEIYNMITKWYNDFKLEQQKINAIIDDNKGESTTQQREEIKRYDEPKLFYKFKTSIDNRGLLFDFLKQEKYIDIVDNEDTCIRNSFNYIFQIERKDKNIKKFKKINWLGSQSLLVVLIGELSKDKIISSKKIWRTAIDCFRVNGEEIQNSSQQLSNIYSNFNNPKSPREINDSKKIIDFIKSLKI